MGLPHRALLALAALVLAPGAATAGPQEDRQAAYAALAALPDWSGVWSPDWASLFGPGVARPALTPEAARAVAEYTAKQAQGENLQSEGANCIPPGMPGIMRMPYPIEFLFTPGRVTLFTETYSQARRFYTDGRALPEDPDPAFNGWSVGRWEGDTLVVDTIGVNSKNSVMPGLRASEAMRLQERIRLETPDRIVIETRITDPAIFTQPYVTRQAYVRQPDWEIREYVCEENNRDASDPLGRPSMDID